MAQAAVAAEPYADRRRRTDELRRRHAFAREVLDFYGALLAVQEQAYEEAAFREARCPRPGSLRRRDGGAGRDECDHRGRPTQAARRRRASTRERRSREFVAAWMQGATKTIVDRFLARASVASARSVGVRSRGPPVSGCEMIDTAPAAGHFRSSATSGSRPKTSRPAAAFSSARAVRAAGVCAHDLPPVRRRLDHSPPDFSAKRGPHPAKRGRRRAWAGGQALAINALPSHQPRLSPRSHRSLRLVPSLSAQYRPRGGIPLRFPSSTSWPRSRSTCTRESGATPSSFPT